MNKNIGFNHHQQKLKTLKFLLDSIPLRVLFIIDQEITELDGIASKALVE
jgi:hypothetical protein